MFNWIQPSINTLQARLETLEVALREAQERIEYLEYAMCGPGSEEQSGRDLALSEYDSQFSGYSPTQELLLQEVIGEDVITHMSGDKSEIQEYMKTTWIAAKPPQFYVSAL